MKINIEKELFSLSDKLYREFQGKLIPGVPPESIIGVRTPDLRALAKKIKGSDTERELLASLPHRYYEENNLHGFLISLEKDFDRCIALLDRFLPYVDNWATCDGIRPACFYKNHERLIEKIRLWTGDGREYTVRFGLEMLMVHFLDGDFLPEYHVMAKSAVCDDYYVNMMVAWYFATALAKRYEDTVGYLERRELSPWVHNKTISKACDSLRISKDKKDYLRSLRRKES